VKKIIYITHSCDIGMCTMEIYLKIKSLSDINRFLKFFLPENVKSAVSVNRGLYSLLNIVAVDFE